MLIIHIKDDSEQIIWTLYIDGHHCSFWDTVPEKAAPILESFGYKHKKDFIISEKRLNNEYSEEELEKFLCG